MVSKHYLKDNINQDIGPNINFRSNLKFLSKINNLKVLQLDKFNKMDDKPDIND